VNASAIRNAAGAAEAPWPSLAAHLRRSRVCVLYLPWNGRGADVRRSMMPLLGRRGSDRRPGALETLPAGAACERRGLQASIEVPVYFDAWNEDCLREFEVRIASALIVRGTRVESPLPTLSQGLQQWSSALPARFVFVLDRFEHCAVAAGERRDAQAFVDELVRVANDAAVDAHFLVAMSGYAQPLFEPIAQRLHDFDTHWVNVCQGVGNAGPLDEEDAAVDPPVIAKAMAHAAAPARVDASSYRPSHWTRARRASLGLACEAMTSRSARRGIALGACASMLVLGGISWQVHGPLTPLRALAPTLPTPSEWAPRPGASTPPPGAGVNASDLATTPAGGATASPRPPEILVAVDDRSGSAYAAARDLARAVATDVTMAVADAGTPAAASVPRLRIVTFDENRPRPRSRGIAGGDADPYRILTPLYTEEFHFVARRDSPLASVGDLARARVNFGAAGTGARASAVRLFERLFAQTVAPGAGALDTDEALRRLAAGNGVDVVVVVDGQPSVHLSQLSPELAASLRLLPIDLAQPAMRAATEDYLPAKLHPASYPGWSAQEVPALATMAFLVTPDFDAPGAATRFRDVARSLCRNLAALRRQGHPKWREVQPGFALDDAWRIWPPAQSAFRACAEAAPTGVAMARMQDEPQRGALP
jgi:hypothetical protein